MSNFAPVLGKFLSKSVEIPHVMMNILFFVLLWPQLANLILVLMFLYLRAMWLIDTLELTDGRFVCIYDQEISILAVLKTCSLI